MNWIRWLAQGNKKDPAAHMNRIQMDPDEKQTEPKGSTTMFACNPGKNFWADNVKNIDSLVVVSWIIAIGDTELYIPVLWMKRRPPLGHYLGPKVFPVFL